MLLVSSTFVVPISAAAVPRNPPVILAGEIPVPIGMPNLPSSEGTIVNLNPQLINGQVVRGIPPQSVSLAAIPSRAMGEMNPVLTNGQPSASIAPLAIPLKILPLKSFPSLLAGGDIAGSNIQLSDYIPPDGIYYQNVQIATPEASLKQVEVTKTRGVLGEILGFFGITTESYSITAQADGNAGIMMKMNGISGGPVSVTTESGMVSSSQVFFAVSPSGQAVVVTGINSIYSGSMSQSYSSTVSLTSITSAIPGLWLDSSKRRSRSQIYVEILELMKRGPMTPFEIAFYARLNHKRTKDYAEFLKRSGYLETVVEDGRMTYVLTKNGIVFLDGVKALFESNRATEYVNF